MIEQIAIAFTGVIAVWLSQDKRPAWRKWACIFGLAGQPFWIYATFKASQWGIFILTFIYAWSWLRGYLNFWRGNDEQM